MAGRTNSTNGSSIKASMAASSNFTRSNKSSDASLQSAIDNIQNQQAWASKTSGPLTITFKIKKSKTLVRSTITNLCKLCSEI
jgi:hypothetical protein